MVENSDFHGLWGVPRLLMTEESLILAQEERPLTMELAKQASEEERCKALLIEVRRSEGEPFLPLEELVRNRPEGLDSIAWFMTPADKGEHRTIILHDNLDTSYHWGTLTELMKRYTLDCLNIDPGAYPIQWLEGSTLVTVWLEEQELHSTLPDMASRDRVP